jgi:hypothetical protein
MAAAVTHRIGSGEVIVPEAREFVQSRFAWSSTIAAVEEILDGSSPVREGIAESRATKLGPTLAV